MESPRVDSATALARTPLFSQLGRLDLARLAGELEELHFAPGQVIVREGDPADGFYVINAGQVEVVTEAQPRDEGPLTLLGAGEGFGEMALLTDSPRSATVMAHTNVTVWRLSRARFDTLLGHERAIARSIEQALSHRLSAITHEAGALRAVGHGLARRALAALSPAAAKLLPAVTSRPHWPTEVLARVGERTGTAAALAELRELPGLLRADGARLVVDGAFTTLAGSAALSPADPVDPAWLRVAAEELAASGDVVGAVDLQFAAQAFDEVARRVVEDPAPILGAASVRDLDRWIARAVPAAPALAEGLGALRSRLIARPPSEPAAGPAEGRAPVATLLRRLTAGAGAVRLLGAAAAVVVFALACLVPEPAGLSRAGLVALGAIMATVPLLVVDVLPDYVVMLLLTTVLVVSGLVPAAAMLAGFATPTWMMILTLLAVGTAISRSGLMFRLVLVSLRRLPPSFVTQSLVLCGAGVLLTAGLTSGSTRIALGVPIARGIADAMGFGRQSRGAAAIGLLTFFTFLQAGELFLTGTFTGLVVHDLLPAAARSQITWWKWFLVALPPFVVILGLGYASVLWIFRPQGQARVNLEAIRLQQELLGPLTWNEVWSAVALVGLVAGFATRPYHGIAPAWLAVGVFLLLFVLGVLDRTALQTGGTLGLLVYAGVILSLGNVFTTLHLDAWLTSFVRSGMPGFILNPYGFVLVVALIAFVLHFFVPWMTASTLLALITMPLAEGLGFHPFIPVLVALIAGDHTLLPYVNSGYAILYFASEGELFSHAQARRPLMLEGLFRVAALLASVPLWQLMKLM